MNKVINIVRNNQLEAYRNIMLAKPDDTNLMYIKSITNQNIIGLKAKIKNIVINLHPKNLLRRIFRQDEYYHALVNLNIELFKEIQILRQDIEYLAKKISKEND